jgi:hypothetical protein
MTEKRFENMKLSSFEYNSFFDNVSGRFDKYNR